MAFFEDLKKNITDAGQTVSQKTKNFTDEARMKSEINDMDRQINRLYVAIGQNYYQAHKDDASAADKESMDEITRLIGEINTRQDKINMNKGMIKCPNCGAALQAGSVFCNSCGKELPKPEPAQAQAGGKFCPQCGAQVADGSAFCPSCGAKIQ
ncbi:MAG: zinc ribbon domain-containing protein [Clostridiales bacterium]|nr:zinc ribbon domain-containing protein [Clostridiales bacterium]